MLSRFNQSCEALKKSFEDGDRRDACPTRGLRHAFAQVLQTETGKALTVSFTAANTKSVSWPKRIGGGLAGFAALWGVVAFVTARATKRERK